MAGYWWEAEKFQRPSDRKKQQEQAGSEIQPAEESEVPVAQDQVERYDVQPEDIIDPAKAPQGGSLLERGLAMLQNVSQNPQGLMEKFTLEEGNISKLENIAGTGGYWLGTEALGEIAEKIFGPKVGKPLAGSAGGFFANLFIKKLLGKL